MKFQYYFEGGNILDSVPLFYLLSGRPKAFQWEPKKNCKGFKIIDTQGFFHEAFLVFKKKPFCDEKCCMAWNARIIFSFFISFLFYEKGENTAALSSWNINVVTNTEWGKVAKKWHTDIFSVYFFPIWEFLLFFLS